VPSFVLCIKKGLGLDGRNWIDGNSIVIRAGDCIKFDSKQESALADGVFRLRNTCRVGCKRREVMIKRTTIIIDKELWRKFRIHSLKQKKTASQLLEELIKREVGR
jgi:hypothetical protein